MSKLIVLVGIQASGKTTHAENIAKEENAFVLSSDTIREEMYGPKYNPDSHTEVFEEMNRRARVILDGGMNVIYDATNLNRKRRVHLINQVLSADVYEAHYMNASVTIAEWNDKRRGNKVGPEIISRSYKSLQIPIRGEGWDKVKYFKVNGGNYLIGDGEEKEKFLLAVENHEELFHDNIIGLIPELKGIFNMPQDSSYHSFSVSRHTYYVYKHIKERFVAPESERAILLWAALFHDVGKGYCKTFENFKGETVRHARFTFHENVSAQIAVQYLKPMGYSHDFIEKVATLVQYHMIPMGASEKKMDQVRATIGDALYEKLLVLHKADTLAK